MFVISYSQFSFCEFKNTFSGRKVIELDETFLLRGNLFSIENNMHIKCTDLINISI